MPNNSQKKKDLVPEVLCVSNLIYRIIHELRTFAGALSSIARSTTGFGRGVLVWYESQRQMLHAPRDAAEATR